MPTPSCQNTPKSQAFAKRTLCKPLSRPQPLPTTIPHLECCTEVATDHVTPSALTNQKAAYNPDLERRALQYSLIGTFVMSLMGLSAGIFAHSQAILLDGMFSVLAMAMTGLALFTTRLVHRPDDARFQFGYAHLEPLTTVLQGLFVLAVCVLALVSGFEALHGNNEPLRLDIAFGYTLVTAVLCLLNYRYLKVIGQKTGSEIIRVDAHEWLIDGLLTATLLVGFIIALLIAPTRFGKFVPYIDPILTMILAVIASIVPFNIVRRNIQEVLLVSPDDINRRLRDWLGELARVYDFADYSCHFAKSGRQYDIEINILVTDNARWTLDAQDAVRAVIERELSAQLGEVWLSVSFTRQAKWL